MRITVGPRTLLAKTCVRCGLFKMADQFGFVRGGKYKDSFCRACHNLDSRPGIVAHQDRAKAVAVKHRQPWTARELDRLHEMTQKGLSAPKIALALNRTVYAIYTARNRVLPEYLNFKELFK